MSNARVLSKAPTSALALPIGTTQTFGQTASSNHQSTNVGSIGFGINDGGGAYSGVFVYNTYSSPYSSQDIRFFTAQGGVSVATERMRIDPAGNLLVGTTSAYDNSGVGTKIKNGGSSIASINCTFNSSNSGSTFQLYNIDATYNGYRFYVNYNGGLANYQAYNQNISDQRTKDRIELSDGYLEKICAIPVKLFNYKGEPEGEQKTLGIIAQDVEKVAPELVSNEGFGELPDDGIPIKTIYQTDLQYALMKAIQELKAEVDSLKAQIAK